MPKDTKVWIAEMPEHMIHLNEVIRLWDRDRKGERMLSKEEIKRNQD